MDPRIAVVVALALLLPALAGCLGQPDQQGPFSPTGDDVNNSSTASNDTDAGDEVADDGRDGNQTDAGDEDGDDADGSGNETDDGGDGNQTDPNATDPGWPDPGSAAIRPGATILGGDCTANFVFSSPDNATLYIGTASHCVGGRSIGASVTVGGIGGAGRIAYCSFEHTMDADGCPETERVNSATNDFALVEIVDDHRDSVHPSMKNWGGPTGMAASPSLGTQAKTYGNSQAREPASALDPREGVVVGSGGQTTDIYVAPPSIPGDSGSPAMTADGQAIGSLIGTTTVPAGADTYSNLDHAVSYMENHTDLEVELKTWSLSDGSPP